MDFTRQPIIETIITPKEGCKLAVRSSKNAGQEEYFVDAVEVVSFGNALFFRSVERPKAFLVPANDYEVLEVREARMVLKNVGIDRTIKIGGGREIVQKATKEATKTEAAPPRESVEAPTSPTDATGSEIKVEKRREKRRHSRRRRSQEDVVQEDQEQLRHEGIPTEENASAPLSIEIEKPLPSTSYVSTLLPPPPTLISETIARYKENALFQGAFFVREHGEGKEAHPDTMESSEFERSSREQMHPEDLLEAISMQNVQLEPSIYGTFETVDDGNAPSEEEQPELKLPLPPLPDDEAK